MNLKDLAAPKAVFARYLKKSPMHLVSQPGIGKTSLCHQFSDILSAELKEATGASHDVPVIIYSLATAEPADLVGYQLPSEDHGVPITCGTKPRLLADMERAGQVGILLFDEFAKGNPDVQAATSPYLLDGIVDGYDIPKGWWVIAASNRAEDGAGDNAAPSHITNRLEHVPVDFDADALVDHMTDKGYDHTVRAFVSLEGSRIAETPHEDGGQYCTPRSLSQLYELHKTYSKLCGSDNLVLDEHVRVMAAGKIGAKSHAYCEFVNIQERVPSFREIAECDSTTKLKDLAYGISHELGLVHSVTLMIADRANTNTPNEHLENVVKFLEFLPTEIASGCVATIMQKMGGVAFTTQCLVDYSLKHNLEIAELNR